MKAVKDRAVDAAGIPAGRLVRNIQMFTSVRAGITHGHGEAGHLLPGGRESAEVWTQENL